jgi:hypothetical protein
VTSATRVRLTSAGDWLTAVLFFAGTVLLALLIVRELRGAPRAFPSRTEPATTAGETVPSDAVSIPTLMVDAVHEIRVGDRAIDALAHLGSGVTLVKRSSERGPLGSRDVRFYELAGTTFILVLEPFERHGEVRLAAIYLQ